MPKKSMHDALVAALLARGEQEVQTRATRYRTFSRQFSGLRTADGLHEVDYSGKRVGHWFVTRGGALRVGATFAGSLSVKDTVKKALLTEGGYGKK